MKYLPIQNFASKSDFPFRLSKNVFQASSHAKSKRNEHSKLSKYLALATHSELNKLVFSPLIQFSSIWSTVDNTCLHQQKLSDSKN